MAETEATSPCAGCGRGGLVSHKLCRRCRHVLLAPLGQISHPDVEPVVQFWDFRHAMDPGTCAAIVVTTPDGDDLLAIGRYSSGLYGKRNIHWNLAGLRSYGARAVNAETATAEILESAELLESVRKATTGRVHVDSVDSSEATTALLAWVGAMRGHRTAG